VPLAVKELLDVRLTFLVVVYLTSVPMVVCLARFAAILSGVVVAVILVKVITDPKVLKKLIA